MSEASVLEIEPIPPRMSLVRPVVGLAELEEAFEEFENVRERLLKPSDYQRIGGKRRAKRSGWRKLTTAFSVDLRRIEREIVRNQDGYVDYAEFEYRAIAPNGRFVDAFGSCDRYERCCQPGCRKTSVAGKKHYHCPSAQSQPCPGYTHFSHANHDIPATAETRAKNRAAADLFGLGEMSAEEVAGDGEPVRAASEPQTISQPQLAKLGATIDKVTEAYKLPKAEVEQLAKVYTTRKWRKTSRARLTRAQASELIDELERWLTEGMPTEEAARA